MGEDVGDLLFVIKGLNYEKSTPFKPKKPRLSPWFLLIFSI